MDVSRLSRGSVPSVPRRSCPIYVELHINQVGTSWMSRDSPPNHPQDTSEAHTDHQIPFFRQEKRAQRLTIWVQRPPGGVGVFHAKRWWPKSSCPPSKVCLPWVSKRGIRDVPGILPGCPGPRVFKKFVKKSSCAFFVPYLYVLCLSVVFSLLEARFG